MQLGECTHVPDGLCSSVTSCPLKVGIVRGAAEIKRRTRCRPGNMHPNDTKVRHVMVKLLNKQAPQKGPGGEDMIPPYRAQARFHVKLGKQRFTEGGGG